MDYRMIEKMIEDKGAEVQLLQESYGLKPGVVFVPPYQMESWKASYLVIEDTEDFHLCVRLSFREKTAAGTYDLILDDIIIETWNVLTIPKVLEIKGYKQFAEEVLDAVAQVRRAWWDDELPNVPCLTGRDIFSDPDRLLFYESELQANEGLQRDMIEGTEQFASVKLWERIGRKISLTDYFSELQPADAYGNLSAYIHHQNLFLSWETDSNTPPPEASVRETGSGLFEISNWDELKEASIWECWIRIPAGQQSLVLKIGETECPLEILPPEQDVIPADSPLSLALFHAFEASQYDAETFRPDDLLGYSFGCLEKKLAEESQKLSEADKLGFAISAGMCCEGLSETMRLSLFQRADEKLSDGDVLSANTVVSRLMTWKERGFSYDAEWFYRPVFESWYGSLGMYKEAVDKFLMVTEEDIEKSLANFLNGWDSASEPSWKAVIEKTLATVSEGAKQAVEDFVRDWQFLFTAPQLATADETPMKGNIPVTKKEAALPDPHIRFVPVTFPSKGGEFHFLESDIVEPLKDYALASDKSFMAFCVTDKGISIPSPPKAVSSSSSPKIEVPPNTEIVFIAFGQSGKLKKLKKTFDKKKKPPIRKGQQICWGVYAPFGLKDMQKNPQEMLIYEALLLLEEASSGDANLMRMHLDGLTFRQMAEQMLDGKSPDQEMIENKANAIQQQFKRPRIGSMAKFSLIVNRLMAKHGWNYDELL